MLSEVSGNPLFLNSQQVMVQVNDCQISVFCMNQEDISVKVRGPLSHRELSLEESYTLTRLSKLRRAFYDLASTPFGFGRRSVNTAVSRCRAGRVAWSQQGRQKQEKKKKKRSSCQVP